MTPDEQRRILESFDGKDAPGLPPPPGSDPAAGRRDEPAEPISFDEVSFGGGGGMSYPEMDGQSGVIEVLERILAAIENIPDQIADRLGVDD